MVQYRRQEVFVELKGIGKLLAHLPNAVHKLHKHRRPVRVTVMLITMADPLNANSTISKESHRMKCRVNAIIQIPVEICDQN